MKKFTLLLMSLLMVTSLAFAQKKLCVHKLDGTKLEVLASEVSYIDFEDIATDPDDDPVAPETGGFVAKPFSVSESKTVTFSPGNLQYHAANNEWRFAPSQTDYIGEANENISSTYNGWIDLFGWGTGNNPTNASTDDNDYKTFVDWGVNKIGSYAPYSWRTLTYDEWRYLCYYRSNADKLIGVAQVNGVNGLILLPDSWTCPSGVTFKSGFHDDYSIEYYAEYQTFSSSDWAKLEASGAVFFPASGYRCRSGIDGVQDDGSYWSATEYGNNYNAYYLSFDSSVAYVFYGDRGSGRDIGQSVRLVLRVGFTYDAIFDSNGGEGTMPSITNDYAKQLSIPANKFTRPGYEFICWNTKADGTGVNYEEGDVFSVASDITLYAQWYKNETNITHEYVDLGLSVKWATCNVGATKPEETGYFFAWGETRPKAKYDWSTHKWCEGNSLTLTKYCTDSYYGTVDNKTILELSDDAANATWGGSWRMPTEAEQDELRTECTWTWTTQNGVSGYTVIGPNGNSIFLPAAGFRKYSRLENEVFSGYWSSSLSTSYSSDAFNLFFNSGYVNWNTNSRDSGRSVRPVMAK